MISETHPRLCHLVPLQNITLCSLWLANRYQAEGQCSDQGRCRKLLKSGPHHIFAASREVAASDTSREICRLCLRRDAINRWILAGLDHFCHDLDCVLSQATRGEPTSRIVRNQKRQRASFSMWAASGSRAFDLSFLGLVGDTEKWRTVEISQTCIGAFPTRVTVSSHDGWEVGLLGDRICAHKKPSNCGGNR